MHDIGYEALMIAVPLLIASYTISFLLTTIRIWAFAEDRRLWTRPRLLLVSCLLTVLIGYYLHWIVVYSGLLVADFHRVLGMG